MPIALFDIDGTHSSASGKRVVRRPRSGSTVTQLLLRSGQHDPGSAFCFSYRSSQIGRGENVRLSKGGKIREVPAMRFPQRGLVGCLKQDNFSRDALPMESQLLLKACLFRGVTLSVIERQNARKPTSRTVIVNQEDQVSTSKSASLKARKLLTKSSRASRNRSAISGLLTATSSFSTRPIVVAVRSRTSRTAGGPPPYFIEASMTSANFSESSAQTCCRALRTCTSIDFPSSRMITWTAR
jgi:hypothetical protein